MGWLSHLEARWKNWQCLWCNQNIQIINATKAIAHILGKKGIHIKSFCFAKDKTHTTTYQELQHYKQTQKGVLLDYSEKIRASITSLQNKSSAAIKPTIHSSSKSITSAVYCVALILLEVAPYLSIIVHRTFE